MYQGNKELSNDVVPCVPQTAATKDDRARLCLLRYRSRPKAPPSARRAPLSGFWRVVPLTLMSVVTPASPASAQQPVLMLPFTAGESHQCVQGPGGTTSHNTAETRFDIDLDTSNSSDGAVAAAAAGTAYVFPDAGPKSFGNRVQIDHGPVDISRPTGDRYFTIYGHLKTFLVRNGQDVMQGQAIGMEGCTGFCHGDHVHFGLHVGNPRTSVGRSIAAEMVIAKDSSNASRGFRQIPTTDFVCGIKSEGDPVDGHSYVSNNTVPAGCMGSAWSFAGSSQCWSTGPIGGAISANFTESSSDDPGTWVLQVLNDPQLISPPLGWSASLGSVVEVELASQAADTTAQVFFATADSGSFSERNQLTQQISSSGAYGVYRFDFSSNPGWAGTITRLRLDPVATGGGAAVGIRSIRILSPSTPQLAISPSGAVPQGTPVSILGSGFTPDTVAGLFLRRAGTATWTSTDVKVNARGAFVVDVATSCDDAASAFAVVARDAVTWLKGDLNGDGIVNSLDWSVMNARWFTADPLADINRDRIVNSVDFSVLNTNWFRTGTPTASGFSLSVNAQCSQR